MAPWFEVFAVGQRNCREQAISLRTGLLVRTTVGVEKGTKAVISANSSVYGGLEFNNLRSNFVAEIPGKEFFNSHNCSPQLSRSGCTYLGLAMVPSSTTWQSVQTI